MHLRNKIERKNACILMLLEIQNVLQNGPNLISPLVAGCISDKTLIQSAIS